MGTNADGTVQPAYCSDCFAKGVFADYLKLDLNTYSEGALPIYIAHGVPEEQAKAMIAKFPTLIYWKYKK